MWPGLQSRCAPAAGHPLPSAAAGTEATSNGPNLAALHRIPEQSPVHWWPGAAQAAPKTVAGRLPRPPAPSSDIPSSVPCFSGHPPTLFCSRASQWEFRKCVQTSRVDAPLSTGVPERRCLSASAVPTASAGPCKGPGVMGIRGRGGGGVLHAAARVGALTTVRLGPRDAGSGCTAFQRAGLWVLGPSPPLLLGGLMARTGSCPHLPIYPPPSRYHPGFSHTQSRQAWRSSECTCRGRILSREGHRPCGGPPLLSALTPDPGQPES